MKWFLLGACSLLAMAASGQSYRLTMLGRLPGGANSLTFDVAPDGGTAVGRSESGQGPQAFIWTARAGMIGLGDLPGGGFESWGLGVSRLGEVVVGYSHTGLGWEAFRWTSTSGMVGLGDLTGGSFFSQGTGVVQDGSIVVGYSSGSAGNEAFRWTLSDGMVGLGDLPGGGFGSRANGVSADGRVVVGQGGSASGPEAFRWVEGVGMTGLGDLPGGGFDSYAQAASGDGKVVCGYGNGVGGREAFRWTEAGGMIGLGQLPGGGSGSQAHDANQTGSVVVGYGSTPSTSEAFVWRSGHSMVSLHRLLVDEGLIEADDWMGSAALACSRSGRIVAGLVFDALGQQAAIAADIAPLLIDRVRPTAATVTRGNTLYGGLPQILEADDDYLLIQQRFPFSASQPNAQVVVEGTAPTADALYLGFWMESSCNGFPSNRVTQRVEFYDYQAQGWVDVDQRAPNFSDVETYVPDETEGVNRFIDPLTRQVRARLSWFDRGTLSPGWGVAIDKVIWGVIPNE